MGTSFTAFDPSAYAPLIPLLEPLDSHLAAFSLLAGSSAGQVYAAPPDAPELVLARAGHRLHLAGTLNPAHQETALSLLGEELLAPQPGSGGSYVLHAAPQEWIPVLESGLAHLQPFSGERSVLEHSAPGAAPPASFPAGYFLREVSPALLADPHLAGLDLLADEMCSERESLEAFYARSFGLCLFYEQQLAAFCLSEYNLGARCEIGIATLPEHQRQGLATRLTQAFLAFAARRGIRRVGWHAWTANEASVATALKAGFSLKKRETVLYGFYDPALHHAVGGNRMMQEHEEKKALESFNRAFALGDPPAWAYWNAAVCHARLGEDGAALGQLHAAARRGMDDPQAYRSSPHFVHLHGTPGWLALLNELEAGLRV